MIIVVGVDGSGHSIAALKRAGMVAAALDAELRVAYCSYLSPMLLSAMEGAAMTLDDTTARQRQAAWSDVEPVLAELDLQNAQRVELSGYPPDALVSYAEKESADLIVVGSRGYGAVASLLLGSTSHRILNIAHCDVMVVKGQSE